MNRRGTEAQGGFSLLELLIAIVCTLFVSGAIFAMITAGNNAFRREPALSDMQQNARIAMDLIQRDVAAAGNEMGIGPPPLPLYAQEQVFTRGLNGVGPNASDMLEVLGSQGSVPSLALQPAPLGTEVQVMLASVPTYYKPPAGLFVTIQQSGFPYTVPGFSCPGGSSAQMINFIGGPLTGPVSRVVPAQLAHYEIQADADGMLSLFRSATGVPGTSPCGAPGGGLELVARGIVDLQVSYLMGMAPNDTAFVDNLPALGAPFPAPPNLAGIVRKVMVTITAQTTERLAGDRGANINPIRTTLVSEIAPRAAAAAFVNANGLPAGRWSEWE